MTIVEEATDTGETDTVETDTGVTDMAVTEIETVVMGTVIATAAIDTATEVATAIATEDMEEMIETAVTDATTETEDLAAADTQAQQMRTISGEGPSLKFRDATREMKSDATLLESGQNSSFPKEPSIPKVEIVFFQFALYFF